MLLVNTRLNVFILCLKALHYSMWSGWRRGPLQVLLTKDNLYTNYTAGAHRTTTTITRKVKTGRNLTK